MRGTAFKLRHRELPLQLKNHLLKMLAMLRGVIVVEHEGHLHLTVQLCILRTQQLHRRFQLTLLRVQLLRITVQVFVLRDERRVLVLHPLHYFRMSFVNLVVHFCVLLVCRGVQLTLLLKPLVQRFDLVLQSAP